MTDSNDDRNSSTTFAYKRALGDLYADLRAFGSRQPLDKMRLTTDEIETRVLFGRKLKGQLAHILRKRHGATPEEAAAHVNWSASDYALFENGALRCEDPTFIRLCEFFGAKPEAEKLFNKIEEAFTPGLETARRDHKDLLEMFGMQFDDEAETEAETETGADPRETKGQVLQFQGRRDDKNRP